MKEVVERRTCDIGGEVAFSDAVGAAAITTLTFDLAGAVVELECCGNCRGKLMTDCTLSDVIQKGRRIEAKPRRKFTGEKPTPKDAAKAMLHVGDLPPEDQMAPGRDGKYMCHACGSAHPTYRGLSMHWARSKSQMAKAS